MAITTDLGSRRESSRKARGGPEPPRAPDTSAIEHGEAVDDLMDAVEATTEELAEGVADTLRRRPVVLTVIRAGWVAKAVVYAAMAWAGLEIAYDHRANADAEYTGIAAELADGSVTRVLLAVIAVGLLLYIAYRVLSVALIDECDAEAWAHRVAYAFSAAVYAAIAWVAATAAIEGAHEDETSVVETIGHWLLRHDVGRVALVIGSLATLGLAAYFAHKGVSARFLREIDLDTASATEQRLLRVTGSIGWIGRAAVIGVVAGFLLWAGIFADPGSVEGLDSSLHELAATRPGRPVVAVISVAMLVYAFFCLLSSRRRDPSWSDAHAVEDRDRAE